MYLGSIKKLMHQIRVTQINTSAKHKLEFPAIERLKSLMAGWGSVSKVLEIAKDFQAPEVSDNISDSEVHDKLVQFGVDVSDGVSKDEQLKCYAILSSQDFWRQFFHLHAHRGYVKNWMWVHDKYRQYLDAMVNKAQAAIKVEGAEFQKVAKKLKGDFEKFHSKICNHSTFEDEQLFKFFLENNPGECNTELEKLMEEHQDTSATNEVREALGKGADESQGLLAAIQQYSEGMKVHMANEEKVLVQRWLSLSKEEYKKYRSYLSWKYAMMY